MRKAYLLLALVGCMALPVQAQGTVTAKQTEVMKKLLVTYANETKELNKRRGKPVTDVNFSAEIGREFYLKRRTWQESDFTCSGCHTENPSKEGRHIETKKPIKPLAPGANPERFVDVAKVEKNFLEHCLDLHDRDCRPDEKGNFIAYLMSIK